MWYNFVKKFKQKSYHSYFNTPMKKGLKTKNIQQNILVFLLLFFLGFSFLVLAQEKSNSSKNIFLDTDQDGLSDEEEKLYGTDPQNKDTDNDGYSDGAEIKSGYNPLLPSPGDRLIPEKDTSSPVQSTTEENKTTELAAKISAMSKEAEASGEAVDVASIQEMVNSIIDPTDVSEETTLSDMASNLSLDNIKIKEQNYGNLSAKKQAERKKEDAIEYLSAVYYILSSNSPEPITSENSASSVVESISQQFIQAMTQRSTRQTEVLKESGEKILSQVQDVEVPEDMLDIHAKALSLAQYSIEMEKYIAPDPTDPIADIQNMSKIQGLISNAINFAAEIENKLSEYDLDFENDIQSRLKDMGISYF